MKLTTTEKIVKLKTENPSMTQSQIAEIVGCSRINVRRVFLLNKIPTKTYKNRKYCNNCGSLINRQSKFLCYRCHRKKSWLVSRCLTCGGFVYIRARTHKYRTTHPNSKYKGKYYCDKQCFRERKKYIE